jgi:transposase
MILVGIDRGERHHDVCILDPDGQVLAEGRVADGLADVQALIGRHAVDARKSSWATKPTAACWSKAWWQAGTIREDRPVS